MAKSDLNLHEDTMLYVVLISFTVRYIPLQDSRVRFWAAASESLWVLQSKQCMFYIAFLILKNSETCLAPRDLDRGFESCYYLGFWSFPKLWPTWAVLVLTSTSAGYTRAWLLRVDLRDFQRYFLLYPFFSFSSYSHLVNPKYHEIISLFYEGIEA